MNWNWRTLVGYFAVVAPVWCGCGLLLEVKDTGGVTNGRGSVATVRVFNCLGETPGKRIAYPSADTKLRATAGSGVAVEVTQTNAPGIFRLHLKEPGDWMLRIVVTGFGEYYIGGEQQSELSLTIPVRNGRAVRTAQFLEPAIRLAGR